MRRFLSLLLLVAACDGTGLETYPGATDWPPAVPGHRQEGCREPSAQGGMALRKRTLTIPLGGGIESDVDPKLLPNGKLITLQNARQGRKGEVVARTGSKLLGTGLLGTADTLPAPWKLGTLNDCLVSFSVSGVDHPVNMWSPTAGQWATDQSPIVTGRRGPVTGSPTRVTGVGRQPDIAYGSGYYFLTWLDVTTSSTIIIYESAIDATTGKKVFERSVNDGLSSTPNVGVRVVNGYAVFVRDTTAADIAFDVLQISNIDAGVTTTVFATTTNGSATSSTFDILVKDATTISVAYMNLAAQVSAIDFVPSTGTATGWALNNSAAAPVGCSVALNWVLDYGASGKIALAVDDGVAGLTMQWDIPTAGAPRQAAISYTLDAAPGTVGNVAAYTRSNSATGEFTVLYDNNNTSSNALIKAVTRTAAVISPSTTYYRSIALRTKVLKQGSDYYVVGERVSSTIPSRVLVRLPGDATTPLAQFEVGNAFAGGSISAIVNPSANMWVFAGTVQVRFTGQPIGYSAQGTGVDMVTVKFLQAADTTMGAPREAIGNLFAPDGSLGQFDGSSYGETGFAYYPEQPTLTGGGGGALTAGATYSYKLLYSYTDASGRLWRSADSIVKSIAMGANTKVTLDCPTLRIKTPRSVTIEVYRGFANATTTFQKVGTVANSTTVDTVSFVDTTSDATLESGEFLYTNGGVLANDVIPGFSSTAIAGNRLFGVSLDDTSRIWVSSKFVDGQGLRFSEQTVLTIRDQHGGVTGLAAIDDKVIVFKKDAVYAVIGDGPDPTGNGVFAVSLIATDVGTTNPASILETSDGPVFQATSGRIYRITRGLTKEYFGAPVQQYAGESVVGTALLPSHSEGRLYTTGRALVFDLVTGIWSVDIYGNSGSTASPTTATSYAGGAAYSDGNQSTVIVDDFTVYTDAGATNYDVIIETPWIKMAGLQGFGRIYSVQGVGERTSAHTLSLQLAADFNSLPFAAGSVSPGSLWDWEYRYSRKLSNLKVFIDWVAGAGGSAKASALVIEYGVKGGIDRKPAANRVT